jgi:hypothetical protein
MRAVPEKPATMQVALSTIAPFVVGLCTTQVTMAIGERYGRDTLPLVLVGWCVALFGSAAWLNRFRINTYEKQGRGVPIQFLPQVTPELSLAAFSYL